jgi:L-threonylcarbamoyladenylate synthase
MKTELLRADQPGAIDHALDVLNNGGLVAFPTDTIYGVACRLNDPSRIESLLAARGPGSERSIGVLISSPDELAQVVQITAQRITPGVLRLANHYWPGQLTLVLPGQPMLPLNLLRTNSAVPLTPTSGIPIAVRVPDHPFALSLLRRSGPLAVSSASRVAGPNPKMAQDVLAQMNRRIHLLVDGGPVPVGTPSTVVDCTGNELSILRSGTISLEEILHVHD